jgi:hypothetical protein
MLILLNQTVLISQIEECGSELGEPDCRLIEPFIVKSGILESQIALEPWLVHYTDQNTFMIHSDKILTITQPNPKLLKSYEDILN